MGYNEVDAVRLARPKGKIADEYIKILLEKFFQQCQGNFLILLKQKKASAFFMNSSGYVINIDPPSGIF
jgi:hypothetical protein